MLRISSFTVPSPSLFIVNAYLRFSKFAVIVRLELTVIVRGFSLDDVPDHPVKIYSASGVAVIVSVDPAAKEPPVLLMVPPCEAEASILNITTGASDSSSNASFAQVTIRRNVSKNIDSFFIILCS